MSAHTPEVQALLDRQQILDCLHRYRRGIDRHDDELLTSAFHQDATDHHGDFIGTTQEFVDWAAELHTSSSWAAHMHYVDCSYIELDGDVAHSECYVLFVHRRTDGSAIEFGGGRYIDRFERRSGEWKIAARQLLIEWAAKADAAVYADVAAYPHGTWDRTDPSYRRPFELRHPAVAS